MTDTQVVRDDAGHRYEVRVDGALAGVAEFREAPGCVLFTHTEVDDAYAGQGLGTVLAREAVADAVARGATIVPYCPFVATYLRRQVRQHPELAAHVEWPDDDERGTREDQRQGS